MKIAVISNQAFSLLNFRGPLMREMVNRGHDVIAFAPDFTNDQKKELNGFGIQTIDYSISRSGKNPLKEFSVIIELRRLFRIYKPDLCFSYFIKPNIYGTIAAVLAGVPRRFSLYAGLGFAFTDAAGQHRMRLLLRGLVSTLARVSANYSNRIMVQNADDMNELIDRRIVAPEKAVLVGATGVDLDAWPLSPLPDSPLTFILIARLLRDKGIAEYVAAARIIRSQHPEVRFLVLGGIDDNPASITLEEMENWVSEGLIEWPGHVATKVWLCKSHVFVLPSYYREGVPRSTQEAMAIGRAIITTNTPGCKETVIEGQNGILIPPRDHGALASAMQYFIENPGDIQKMGERSRQIAGTLFNIHTQNAKMLDVMGIHKE